MLLTSKYLFKKQVRFNAGLGEGLVRSYLDTDNAAHLKVVAKFKST